MLNPILFIIYINSIQNLPLIGKTILYADDTNLYYTGKDFDEIVQNMQIDLRCMMDWLERERLILNLNKTVFMCFSRSPLTIAVSDLEVDGHLVKRVSTYEFLGLYLTENLSWEVHIKSVIKNIIPACRAIFRTRHCLTFQMKRTLYFALMHSHLTSLSIVWGHCYNQHLYRLVTTQKRALKMIFGLDPRTPSIDLYSKLNLISVSKSI